MKKIILWGIILSVAAAGCYHADELDRSTPAKRSSARTPAKPRQKRSSEQQNPLFEAVFHRNPQSKDDGSSILTLQERELLRQNSVADDPAVRKLHNQRQQQENNQKDWVFGTKNGSYF